MTVKKTQPSAKKDKGIIMAKLSSLVPSPKNPRFIRDSRYRNLVKSLKDFPQMLYKRPFVAFTRPDGKYEVIGGNQRLKACKELKMATVPVALCDDWTQKQRDEFLIKDNLNAGEWDWEKLTTEDWPLADLKDWGVEGVKITAPASNDFNTTPTSKETHQEVECPHCHKKFKAKTNIRKVKSS